jgi:hypothetical protein
MSTTNDTDIVKLNLNDTFYDWYLKTNQIIDYVNPINIYDVFAGVGLQESRTGTPGTIELSVATNPTYFAIDTLVNSDGIAEVILNIAGLSTGTVANTSVYAFSSATSGSQIYKVAASNMLPPTLNGNHTFSGTITVGDLVVNDGNITINYTGASRDNAGIVLEGTDTNTNNVTFTYDTDTSSWYSSENLGLKSGKYFRTDSAGTATFPFYATNTQGVVDLGLYSNVGSNLEKWSIKGTWGSPDTLSFSHYTNSTLIDKILELKSYGTGNTNNHNSVVAVTDDLTVGDTISIGNILNSSPFTQSPIANYVPITDSANGYLNTFVNRSKFTTSGTVSAGHIVKLNASGQVITAVASTEANSQCIGIVESVNGTTATVVLSGQFTVQPRNTSNAQFAMTAGTVYYLDQSVTGTVTSTKPGSGVVKAVIIATSTTAGIFIPDFTNTSLTGLITNAFSSVKIIDTNETITASGATQLVLKGGSNVVLDVNTNGQVVINSTASGTGLPSASARSVFLTQGTTTATSVVVDSYSVLGRSLTGNIGPITLSPGGLLGRRDDTDDTNNPVESLSRTDVLNLLGFSGSNYLKTLNFKNTGGTTIKSFSATSSSTESADIRAGNNVTFTYSSVDNALYISSAGGTNSTGGGNPLDISAAASGNTTADILSLTFESGYKGVSANQYIDFWLRQSTNGVAYISASPTTGFMGLSGNTGSGSFAAGNTLRVVGDQADGVSVGFQTIGRSNTFTVSLANTIRVSKVSSNLGATDSGLLTLSAGIDTDRNTFQLADSSRTNVDSKDEYSVVMNTFDSISAQQTLDASRVSSTGYFNFDTTLQDKCISLYADVTHSSNLVSYPFKFHKLLVNDIVVNNLTVTGTAIKDLAVIDSIRGYPTDTAFGGSLADTSQLQMSADSGQLNGVVLKLTDETSAINCSYIYHPTESASDNLGVAYKSLIMSERIYFSPSGDVDTRTPSIGYESTANPGELVVTSASAQSQIRFDANTTERVTVGCNSGAFLSYYDGGGNSGSLSISSNATFAKISSLQIADSSSRGIRFMNTNIGVSLTSTAADKGKVLQITAVSGSVGLVGKADYVIKPYNSGATVATDPINTLYYTT